MAEKLLNIAVFRKLIKDYAILLDICIVFMLYYIQVNAMATQTITVTKLPVVRPAPPPQPIKSAKAITIVNGVVYAGLTRGEILDMFQAAQER